MNNPFRISPFWVWCVFLAFAPLKTIANVTEPKLAAVAVPTITTVLPAKLVPGQTILLTVSGTSFVTATQIVAGGNALATTYVSPSQVTASMVIEAAPGGSTPITVTNGQGVFSTPVLVITEPLNPRVSYAAAARFLEQAAFGPDPRSIVRVQEAGFEAWLDEQFAMNRSTYPNSDNMAMSLTPVQSRFFLNTVSGEDQLRQRVSFALSQIFVISGYKTFSPQQVMPYMQLLQDNAFRNHADLLRAVTLSPAMGVYLDMANNVRGNSANGAFPNENFARELLQLFSIGTDLLNADGSVQRGSDGKAPPAYTQETIGEFARVFTGWTFAAAPGAASQLINPSYFNAPMQVTETLHDTGAKTLLRGLAAPAGQTAVKDLNDALDNIFQHPNAGPFLAVRLIKALVTSNPSPAYAARISQVFNSNGSGTRGDLRAVVRAILLDPEARAGDAPNAPSPAFGHLREPVLYIVAAIRGVGASVKSQTVLTWYGRQMDQALLYPPSVFGYYSPNYAIPGTTLSGPEFQIFYPSSAVARANFAMTLAFGFATIGVNLNIPQLESLRGDPDAILDFMSRVYLRGRMTSAMKEIMRPAILAFPSSLLAYRAQVALYLTVSCPMFEVQH